MVGVEVWVAALAWLLVEQEHLQRLACLL